MKNGMKYIAALCALCCVETPTPKGENIVASNQDSKSGSKLVEETKRAYIWQLKSADDVMDVEGLDSGKSHIIRLDKFRIIVVIDNAAIVTQELMTEMNVGTAIAIWSAKFSDSLWNRLVQESKQPFKPLETPVKPSEPETPVKPAESLGTPVELVDPDLSKPFRTPTKPAEPDPSEPLETPVNPLEALRTSVKEPVDSDLDLDAILRMLGEPEPKKSAKPSELPEPPVKPAEPVRPASPLPDFFAGFDDEDGGKPKEPLTTPLRPSIPLVPDPSSESIVPRRRPAAPILPDPDDEGEEELGLFSKGAQKIADMFGRKKGKAKAEKTPSDRIVIDLTGIDDDDDPFGEG